MKAASWKELNTMPGTDRYILIAGFQDQTWNKYFVEAGSHGEAANILRQQLETRLLNSVNFRDQHDVESVTPEFVHITGITQERSEEYEEDEDEYTPSPTWGKIMRAKPMTNTNYNDDLEDDVHE